MDFEGLRKKRIYLGTSSWKYPGWKGLVYRREYKSEKSFNETCLEEYAETFPTVGVDHTYYTWPTERQFEKYVSQTPETFRFGLKATENTTVFKFPTHKRYGKKAGLVNAEFLDADAFAQRFLKPLERFAGRLAPIVLEFSQFYPGTISSGTEFVERTGKFFTQLKSHGEFRFAIELRNANWLKPPYFQMLEHHGVGHVFNSWTRMPSVLEQLELAKPYRLPFICGRLLLEPGVAYQEAVEAFAPYDRIHKTQDGVRKAAVMLISEAMNLGIEAYVYVNNRLEGCSPETLRAIVALLTERNQGE